MSRSPGFEQITKGAITGLAGLVGSWAANQFHSRILSGAAFGVGIWLAAVEAALPTLKLTQPPWRYPFRMHAYSLISHLVY